MKKTKKAKAKKASPKKKAKSNEAPPGDPDKPPSGGN
jgi:hypothetical protein